jgi:hypothetical protein
MKTQKPEVRSQEPGAKKIAPGLSPVCHLPSPARRERGIALVITLILLSVTLIMAVAFLAVARRERNSVSTTTDTATARLAADSALAAAQAQIAAGILATNTGIYNYHLLVSTNYLNTNFVAGVASPTNVYYYYPNGNLLVGNDLVQNIANLWLLPRAPVFVYNRTTGSNDFRFYLDANRNGQFEANGLVPDAEFQGGVLVTNSNIPEVGDPEWIGVLERPDQPHGPNNKFIARYAFLAQPIGNSLDLNAIHNQTLNTGLGAADGFFRNQGVGSWELNLAGFLADLNTNVWGQVIGAPSLYYQYNWPLTGFANSGYAFEDARALLAWRYNFSYANLATANNSFTNLFNYPNAVDLYSDGPLQTTVDTNISLMPDNIFAHWAGGDNTNSSANRFFALPSDLFGANGQNLGNFPAHLAAAGNSADTYDRYTFYRLLDQIGTDSTADDRRMNARTSAPAGRSRTDSTADDRRMNVNYRNVTNGVVVPGLETNLFAWTPLEFFTNAADRLLQHYTANWIAHNTNYFTNTFGASTTQPFGVANIPVYVNGQFVYTPAVNRLLQLAANIYDATTQNLNKDGHDCPHVFRPTFWVTNENSYRNIYISGYEEVSSLNSFSIGNAPLDQPVDLSALPYGATFGLATKNANVFGVPWIIGAKKGLPSFNGFSMVNLVQVSRKLQVSRSDITKGGATATNEMFLMGITNQLNFSFWNSYNSGYTSSVPLTVYFSDIVSMALTNTVNPSFPFPAANPTTVQFQFTNNPTIWLGSAWLASGTTDPQGQSAATNSFISGVINYPFLPQSIYRFGGIGFQLANLAVGDLWETNYSSPPVFPSFGLTTTNRVQAFIVDGTNVIDYVQLSGPDVSPTFNDPNNEGLLDNYPVQKGHYWSTNAAGVGASSPTPTWGVINQLSTSQNPGLAPLNGWKTPPNMPNALKTQQLEGSYFAAFFTGGLVKGTDNKFYANTNYVMQAPYTPVRTFWQYVLWQANDPLVHYLASDLTSANNLTRQTRSDNLVNSPIQTVSLTDVNASASRYQPWGRNMQMATLSETAVATNAYDLRFRDPLVWNADSWDFPTGKLPNVGWLGRVHRGTPWQTVYLKQRDVLLEDFPFGGNTVNIGTNTWAQWTGDTQTSFNNSPYDAVNSAPVSDRDLFDLFTATPNANATRGTLSVNQTHLAAWSALFSGLVALTNATDAPFATTTPVINNLIIPPAGPDAANSGVGLILNGTEGINNTRSNFVNADGVVGAFEKVGDILNVPAYTEKSPFLNHSDDQHTAFDISDELYEWLPQQTLGLLRAGDTARYVVYCYGQTLHPAPNGLVLDNSAGEFGLCTNYQITAESAARAVIRVEKHIVNGGTNYSTVIESFNPLPPN